MNQFALSICLVTTLLLFCSTVARGQEESSGATTVNLRFNLNYQQGPVVSVVDFGGSSDEGKRRRGTAPGGVLVSEKAAPGESGASLIRVDTDQDRSLKDEKEHLIRSDSTITVEVQRSSPSEDSRMLPYSVTYSNDRFYWRPHYRAEGTLQVGECSRPLAMLDMNGDGVFDQQDFKRGTTVQIDRNEDGRMYGKGEHLKGNQIIKYCGDNFVITGLAASGASVEFTRTGMPVPEVGEQVPAFTATTMDGRTLSAEKMKGKPYLLDFWASWCAPCVAKFPRLQALEEELSKELQIVAVNVDEFSALGQAKKIIGKYDLGAWPHVMRGKGEADPLWKMFGSTGDTRLAIPLYVLVDREGVVRYAGTGGRGLEELAVKMKAMLDTGQ